jgi:hypothetical protein
MTDHPITPPPELVQQWMAELYGTPIVPGEACTDLAARAAQWGADQELIACGNYLKQCAAWEEEDVIEFYNYRRPKPPSLKEQALRALDAAVRMADDVPPGGICSDQADIIRRALEALDD